MAGLLFDASVVGVSDDARGATTQEEQASVSIKFDSKGNILYKIPKHFQMSLQASLVARHFVDTAVAAVSFGTSIANVRSFVEERGPFDAFWFFQGINNVLDRHFNASLPGIDARLFGGNGGTYAKTDTFSLHPGWTFLTTPNTATFMVAQFTPGITVLSSSFPAEVLGFGTAIIDSNRVAPGVLGAPDYLFESLTGTNPFVQRIHCVFEDIGTFTAVTCIGTNGMLTSLDSGTVIRKESFVRLNVEIKLADATDSGSLVT